MSLNYADLRSLSDKDLIERHDEKAQHTIFGIAYYLNELNHRAIDRQTATMRRLTWVITALTLANVVLVAAATIG